MSTPTKKKKRGRTPIPEAERKGRLIQARVADRQLNVGGKGFRRPFNPRIQTCRTVP